MLRQVSDQLQIATSGPGLTRLSGPINGAIGRSGLQQGLCVALAQHTSCSLTINENADPRVLADLEAYLHDLVPRERRYAHDDEGPDDMPAHIRTALTTTSLSVPFADGQLRLGTWQEVYLWEHRDAPHLRQIALHLIGT
ncbi:MAG: YjbQ family protein [Cyanobacteria bacterium K_DeepCast_35m_m2_155]|nr:YjbQ family protein [Cyanobacteria bacterium K_DeepCast_35m_m2_155]